ncbi:MAG: hypothetical protein HY231_23660 [Acidobacteria bacterium]|nr:hypothetical protein [Acidobacteriota bacterium]
MKYQIVTKINGDGDEYVEIFNNIADDNSPVWELNGAEISIETSDADEIISVEVLDSENSEDLASIQYYGLGLS